MYFADIDMVCVFMRCANGNLILTILLHIFAIFIQFSIVFTPQFLMKLNGVNNRKEEERMHVREKMVLIVNHFLFNIHGRW